MTTIMSPSIQGSGCLYMSINQPLNLPFPLVISRPFPLFANEDSLGRGAIIKMFNFLLPVTTLAIVRNQSPLQKVFSPVITLNFIECI